LVRLGVGFSLLPGVRAAPTVFERRQLIARELRFAVVIAAVGSAAILVLTPLIERWLLEGKYHLSMALLVAALFSGIAKIGEWVAVHPNADASVNDTHAPSVNTSECAKLMKRRMP
jgi:hypothetical protein